VEDIQQDAARAVIERLDELVTLLRDVDARLEHLERGATRRDPFADDPEIGHPRRLALTKSLVDAARVDLVSRAGAT
jgi:hypothetical protein